jgi:hypothetical protein
MNQAEIFNAEKLWLENILRVRFNEIFPYLPLQSKANPGGLQNGESKNESPFPGKTSLPLPPELKGDECLYSTFVTLEDLDFAERLLLAFVFLPHIFPSLYQCKPNQQLRPEFGFTKGIMTEALIPTGQSYIYLYSGMHTDKKLEVMELLCGDSVLFEKNLILLDEPKPGEPLFSGRLSISQAWARLFILDQQPIQKQIFDHEPQNENELS